MEKQRQTDRNKDMLMRERKKKRQTEKLRKMIHLYERESNLLVREIEGNFYL